MNKMQMAHDYFMKHVNVDQYKRVDDEELISWSFDYVDAMQAEADKRNKAEAEAEQKRKEVREILNDANTFIEREGQHFDDVEEWQPDWSQAPREINYWFKNGKQSFWSVNEPELVNGIGFYAIGFNMEAPSFNYQGNWQDSLRERPQ